MKSVSVSVKKSIIHWVYEISYIWNPDTSAFECDKDCKIGEYLKKSEYTKSLVDDLIVTCDETVDTPGTIPINTNDVINY